MSRSDVANRRHRHEHRPVRRVLQVAAIAVVVAWSSASCSGGDTSDAPNDRAAVTAATSSPARFEGFSSSTYAQDRYWLCRPGGTTTNHCHAASLDSTIVRADGTSEVAPHEPAQPASAEFDRWWCRRADAVSAVRAPERDRRRGDGDHPVRTGSACDQRGLHERRRHDIPRHVALQRAGRPPQRRAGGHQLRLLGTT
jgi:hypothetical protein